MSREGTGALERKENVKSKDKEHTGVPCKFQVSGPFLKRAISCEAYSSAATKRLTDLKDFHPWSQAGQVKITLQIQYRENKSQSQNKPL